MKVVRSEFAPAPIGPYSQALEEGGWLYTSGQIGFDAATGALVPGGASAETRRVFENLRAVLAAAGLRFADVVKATVYLVDLADFPIVNEIYAEVFAPPFPARSTVGVASLPKGARVEIDLVARRPA